jgi:hypothetical protein
MGAPIIHNCTSAEKAGRPSISPGALKKTAFPNGAEIRAYRTEACSSLHGHWNSAPSRSRYNFCSEQIDKHLAQIDCVAPVRLNGVAYSFQAHGCVAWEIGKE